MARTFVPASGRFGVTLYDRAVGVTMRERTFREATVFDVAAHRPRRVVEVGCGTGSLAIRLARALPAAQVTGIDPDQAALAIARRKPDADLVRWDQRFADELPMPAASVDAVVMSLVLHHLIDDAKVTALREAARVLRPGGAIHVVDWGRPAGAVTRGAFTVLRALDGWAPTQAHADGRLVELMAQAGLGSVERRARLRTAWGTLEQLRGTHG